MDAAPLRCLLVANRGEIARRVLRTARRLGLRGVAIFSPADRGMSWLAEADLAVEVNSYIDADAILDAARRAGADAIHPGYGFLSERPAFAAAVQAAGLIWVGPPVTAMQAMSSKADARRAMAARGVPVLPGYDGEDQGQDALLAAARGLGLPLMVKASAGGGGKGMAVVRSLG
jgi:acetyl/propionyl-CoA carboxylase alpha subunit